MVATAAFYLLIAYAGSVSAVPMATVDACKCAEQVFLAANPATAAKPTVTCVTSGY
jgi:hypothetical protein